MIGKLLNICDQMILLSEKELQLSLNIYILGGMLYFSILGVSASFPSKMPNLRLLQFSLTTINLK